MSGVWNAITLGAYSANAGRLLTMYSGTVFVDPAYQTVRHAIQTDIAFCFVGILATLVRFILHVCVQCGWLELRCPRWMNMKKQNEDSLHAQPLMDVSSRSNNRAGRPMNPRATRTRTTETRPENATTPVDDPPPPYTSKEHTEVSLTDV
ncbi:uncharacterized protein K489DRAFT_248378 [Dissoconium aciculare CBS 342.82]|uniref:Uncharacterized protein n=1 Tax=Dissoconium aciculare CBS 342.82 TaxID=1314786 RepID=A0A6J3M3F3_9PEZI|nr:uncharacterized protein K489DRAFT_248378 [Dissoconium aciculare CBS 342.82]KAF1821457.1 hypothetical protein K489DRAFT_248378 [Dissoconium aciculare CBS 342.82]